MRVRKADLAVEVCKGLSQYNGVTTSPEIILRSPHFAIYEHSKLMGWIGCTARNNDSYEVRHLTILPHARRKGLGAKALSYILMLLRRRGATKCHAFIRRTNLASIELFEKHGFVLVRDGWAKKYHKSLCEEP